jgi:hypothetical protein
VAEVWRPTDDELIAFAALRGARGVYSTAFDAGVDAVRADADEAREFENSLYNLAVGMGFTGLGLGSRQAILHVFEYAARQRKPEPQFSEDGDPK